MVHPEGLRQWWPEQGERTRIPAGGRASCSMAGASTCSDHFSLFRSRFEARSVTLEPSGPGGGPEGRSRSRVNERKNRRLVAEAACAGECILGLELSVWFGTVRLGRWVGSIGPGRVV
ncbi:phragmoplast orienting kinesin 1-like [Dorcoceras hygrometricum]|uniref:Phragmoplast orienting kinesin 1-like n=1 Tax=Dorcoceras hygrometricum TaxID=472368 RepID=A0A2Z7C1X0_9LAMI|nr:phragmoplast orienting kinesin 1-like [Dorcoceras hygrometricum]